MSDDYWLVDCTLVLSVLYNLVKLYSSEQCIEIKASNFILKTHKLCHFHINEIEINKNSHMDKGIKISHNGSIIRSDKGMTTEARYLSIPGIHLGRCPWN
jgi:hypothetical protein